MTELACVRAGGEQNLDKLSPPPDYRRHYGQKCHPPRLLGRTPAFGSLKKILVSKDPSEDAERAPAEERCPETLAETEADVGAPPGRIVRGGGTFEAFAHRAYTLFWSGAFVSNIGTWMQNYALGVLVYTFRSSEADLGIVNFVSGLPTLVLGLSAGALADRIDRRKLIIWAQVALMAQAAALGLLFSTNRLSSQHAIDALLWVVGLGLVGGVCTALGFPAWQAMLPDLVPRKTLLNAIALNSAQFQSARLLGPLIAGAMVLTGLSIGDIFWVNAISFLFVIWALAVIRPQFGAARVTNQESSWRRLTAGLRYATTENRATGLLLFTVAVLTIFGMPYMMLLPAVVDKALLPAGGSTDVMRKAMIGRQTAYLMAANGLGAVVAALVVASLPPTVRRERLVRWTLLALSVLLIGFGMSRNLSLSLPISALAGAALLTTNSLINTSIQAQVPAQLRGRVMALFVISFMGLMPFSSIIFGLLGEMIGPSKAVLAGAIVLLAYALFLVGRPGMLEHRVASCRTPTVEGGKPG